jgi:TetR/AcrR family transcriptional regulator
MRVLNESAHEIKMSRGRRKVEDPATARRILAAAEQHFAAQGLAGARTEEIATAANANKAMLYYYFGSKRRLHRAVLDNLLRQFRAKVLALPKPGLSPAQQFFQHVDNYFDFLATHPNYPRLLQREAMGGSRNFDWMIHEHFRPLHKLLARALENGVAAGEFRKIDVDQLVLIALGMTTSYFAAAPLWSKAVGHNLLTPQAIAARKRAMFDFLHHGVARANSARGTSASGVTARRSAARKPSTHERPVQRATVHSGAAHVHKRAARADAKSPRAKSPEARSPESRFR